MKAPNLTLNPPRSPRVRLGGYTIFPRLNPERRDIFGIFDYLDLDDYVSFGGGA